MNDHLLPSDTGWTEEKALVADLSHLNTEITRYVLRALDVDAGWAEPLSADDEEAFGQRLINLGNRVQQRAELRRGPVIDGEVAQSGSVKQLGTDHEP